MKPLMKPFEKGKTQKVLEKILPGKFDENDVDNLFMKLREYADELDGEPIGRLVLRAGTTELKARARRYLEMAGLVFVIVLGLATLLSRLAKAL